MLKEINVLGVPPSDGKYSVSKTEPDTYYHSVINIVVKTHKKVQLEGYWLGMAPDDLSFYITERSNHMVRDRLLQHLSDCQNENQAVHELRSIGFKPMSIPLSGDLCGYIGRREEYIAFIVPKFPSAEVNTTPCKQESPTYCGAKNADSASELQKIREKVGQRLVKLKESRVRQEQDLDDLNSEIETLISMLYHLENGTDSGQLSEKEFDCMSEEEKRIAAKKEIERMIGLLPRLLEGLS
jgi:hypothetical protein